MSTDPAINLAAPIVPQIIADLRQAIVEMRLKPGEAISEKETALRYGVSRQPVREAFIKLAEAGLLQVMPSRGTFVVKISVRDVLNARFVREAVESALVRTAATLISTADLERLDDVIARQIEAAASADPARFYALDEEFHRAIVECCECDPALRVIEGARAQMDRVRYLSLPEATPIPVLVAQHRAIIEALRARDPDAAEAAMRRHMREILAALPRLTDRFPDMFESTEVPAHARLLEPR
ncbi:MAG: GntR family transcriptional regulator [Siculibacillus sp.]|nr:GntR family transcriptional regulator [Siculibacillus sp.]